MTHFERFLNQFPMLQGYDQIEMSVAMAEDPEIIKYCNITAGSGSKHGTFLGKPIIVMPDVKGVMFEREPVTQAAMPSVADPSLASTSVIA